MIRLTKLRSLDLERGYGGPAFVSAASGLALDEEWIYVVADDESGLAIFERTAACSGVWRPLLPNDLPLEHAARKREKPDWECLVEIERENDTVVLVAIPSGSRPNRTQGVRVEIGGDQILSNRLIDFSPLFEHLTKSIAQLNIEGAVASGEDLLLFHRGNGSGSVNELIRLDRAAFSEQVMQGSVSSTAIKSRRTFELGERAGVPLTFTDAASDPRGAIWFLATAEAGGSTYDDGEVGESVLGRFDANLRTVETMVRLALPHKPEGLVFDPKVPGRFYVVTDADDRNVPSVLYVGDFVEHP